MFLLFFLDMVQYVAGIRIPKFKDRSVVSPRNIFFRHQHIGTHVMIGEAPGRGLRGIRGLRRALILLPVHVGDFSAQQLVQRIQVGPLLLPVRQKDLLELIILRLIGIVIVLLDADLLMAFLIFQ